MHFCKGPWADCAWFPAQIFYPGSLLLKLKQVQACKAMKCLQNQAWILSWSPLQVPGPCVAGAQNQRRDHHHNVSKMSEKSTQKTLFSWICPSRNNKNIDVGELLLDESQHEQPRWHLSGCVFRSIYILPHLSSSFSLPFCFLSSQEACEAN